jgi:hypothetical protein
MFHPCTAANKLLVMSAAVKIIRVSAATVFAVVLFREAGLLAVGVAAVILQGTYTLFRRFRRRAQ